MLTWKSLNKYSNDYVSWACDERRHIALCYIPKYHFKVPEHAFLHWVTDIKYKWLDSKADKGPFEKKKNTAPSVGNCHLDLEEPVLHRILIAAAFFKILIKLSVTSMLTRAKSWHDWKTEWEWVMARSWREEQKSGARSCFNKQI